MFTNVVIDLYGVSKWSLTDYKIKR